MKRFSIRFALGLLIVSASASGADLTLTQGGRVSIELITSDAAFRNTMSVGSPAVGIAARGCQLEPATGLPGQAIISEKTSQRGCRVELDADAATAGIQPFAAGATFRFNFCAQTDADADCEFVWSSNAASNSDGFDHVRTTALSDADYPGRIFKLEWEDKPDGGDMDFNDLVAVLRVNVDTDSDGLWDDWERFGIDSNADGVIDLDLPNTLPVDLNNDGDTTDPGERISPNHRDILVEIDSMDCAQAGGDCAAGDTHDHTPRAAAVRAAVLAFNGANITNPDGTTGITLRVDLNQRIAHQNNMIIPNACFTGTAGTGFDAVKTANFGPDNPRRFAFHYAVFSHNQTATTTSSGCGELPGNDFQVTFGKWNYTCTGGANAGMFCNTNADCPSSTCAGRDVDGDGLSDADVGSIQQQAGTLIHELGHNLNLQHGGGEWLNNKPNYLSVMNYTFQLGGIPPTDPDGAAGPLTGRVDYSTAVLPTLVENNLTESAGIGDGTDNTSFFCPGATNFTAALGNAAINWNCDTDSTDVGVSSDVNGDANVQCVREGANGALNTTAAGDDVVSGTRIVEGPNRQCDTAASGDDIQWRPVGPLTGFWDWNNILYDFQTTGSFDDGTHILRDVQLREVDLQQYIAESAPDPGLSISAAPSTVVTGSTVTYTITVTNGRVSGASNVVVTSNLPATLEFVSCAATAGGTCGGSGNARSITFPSLVGNGSAVITLVARVICQTADAVTITNIASLTAAADAEMSNNTASVSITTSNPPPVISAASVSSTVLWPPNHNMVDVTVNYTVTDNCDAASAITRALSVTSNEPEEGLGDGDTPDDWEVVDANRIRLRAERSGSGDGRVYTITIRATDSAGYSSTKQVQVSVPKSRK